MKASTPNLVSRVIAIDNSTGTIIQLINDNNKKSAEQFSRLLDKLTEITNRLCHLEAKVEFLLSGSKTDSELQSKIREYIILESTKRQQEH